MKSKIKIAAFVGLAIFLTACADTTPESELQDGSKTSGSLEGEESEYNPLTYYEVETPKGTVGCIIYDGYSMTCDW